MKNDFVFAGNIHQRRHTAMGIPHHTVYQPDASRRRHLPGNFRLQILL
jgi:hypothetical protein